MGTLTGETKTWHKVVIDFTSEMTFTEAPETFRDYRLDVTFTNQDTGETLVVPGFFAADGNAAETGATSGDVWRVNFTPPSEGDWTYEASFRTGNDVAASTNPNVGSPAALEGGTSGSFAVTPTDKTGDDFRAKGMILQDKGTNYLQHQGDGDYFIRGGPGVPENMLATEAFDNTGGGRHDWAAHGNDYGGDGEYWGDTAQQQQLSKNILGAVNYLEEQGQNTVYLLTNTISGDGQDVGPWVNPDIYKVGKNKNLDTVGNGLDEDDFSTYDVSKLAQWAILFDHMDEKGIYKNVLFQETENDQLLNNGTDVAGTVLDAERLIYMREIIARTSHNLAIQWNLGEENTNTAAERQQMAEFVKAVDPYDHLVVVHTYPGDHNKVYDPLLNVPEFDGPSFQTGAGNIRQKTAEFRDKSEASGDPWVLAWDEDSSNNAIIVPYQGSADDTNEQTLREGLWGHLTAGGSGVNWYLKQGGTGHSFDQNIDDWNGFQSLWDWTAAATDFFNTYIPFWEMAEDDGATVNGNDFVMSKPGEYYAIYAEYGQAGDIRLDLSGQGGETFDVFWYNPRDGGPLIADGQISGGGVRQIGGAPTDGNKDWALLVRNADLPDTPPSIPPSDLPDDTGGGNQGGGNQGNGLDATFKVIDPDTNGEVIDLTDGGTIDLGALGLDGLSIQAVPDASVGSVQFWLDGNLVQTENTPPYALFGDSGGDFASGTIAPGQHTLTAEYYGGSGGNGQKLGEQTVSFTVVEGNGGSGSGGGTGNTPPPDNDDPVDVGEGVFIGQDGTVVIEAESAEAVGHWRQVSMDGATGLLWDAPSSSYNRVPDGQTLSYEFVVDESGNYSFATRAGRMFSTMNNSDRYEGGNPNNKQRTDTGNDAYIAVINAETGEVVQAPTKLFVGLGGADRDFKWGTTFDQNHNKYQAKFDLEQDVLYRLEISGRSDGYVLDKVTLNNGGALRDDNAEESPRGTVDDGTPPPPPPPPTNTAPNARNDSVTTEENDPVSIAVLGNDTDADGDTLDITRLDDPSNGEVRLLDDGRVVYTPDNGFSGEDSFTYQVSDGEGGTDTARVDVTVTPLPEPPADEPTPPNPVDNSDLNPDFLDNLVAEAGQIVLHFDGDINDRDDIAALPVAAALLKAAGLEDRTTIFYNNNIQEGNNSGQVQDMRESAAYAESLGFKTYDYTADQDGATEALIAIFDSGDPVLSVEGGPMQAVAAGLMGMDQGKLANITLLSHSSWNENRGTLLGSSEPWSKLKSEYPDVTFIDIGDQNKGNNNGDGFNSNKWSWLDNTNDPALTDLREAMLNAGANSSRPYYNDPSDAGMVFYALTGNQNADPDDAKAFFKAYPLPGSTGGGTPPADDPAPGEASLRVFLAEADGGMIDPANDYELTGGMEIPADMVMGKQMTLYAVPADGSATIESVEMSIPGMKTQTENHEPYALYGDNKGQLITGGSFKPGTHTLMMTLYAENGKKSMIGTQELSFTVLEPADVPAPDLPPVAVGEQVSVAEDGSVDVNLLANGDIDPEGTALTVDILDGPDNGEISLTNGTLSYAPADDFSGSDIVSYRVLDAGGKASQPVDVAITVTPVNDAPVVSDATRTIDEDTSLTIAASALATDIDSSGLVFTEVDGIENGTVELLNGGTRLRYTPAPDYFGTETLEVTVSDGSAEDTGTLTVVVEDVVDQPDPPAEPPSNPGMPEFQFFFADTDSETDMMPLSDDMVVSLADISGQPVTIYATTDDDEFTGSVKLSLNGGKAQLEKHDPYALFGDDTNGDFFDGTDFEPGSYNLSYEVFALDDGTQKLGEGEMSFTVVDAPSMDIGFYTTNKSKDTKVASLSDGATLDADLLDGHGPLSIGMVLTDDSLKIGSVIMTLNDDHTQTENLAPYALFGNNGDNYHGGQIFDEGDNTLVMEIYEGRNGSGALIEEVTIDFTLV